MTEATERQKGRTMRALWSTTLTAALAAILVFVLLLPVRGNDSDPPECFAVLDYVVPCGLGPEQRQGMGFALGGAVIAAALVAAGSAVGRWGRIRE